MGNVRRELLDQMCHESRNLAMVAKGMVKEMQKLQEFPIKNRSEIEWIQDKLVHRLREFNQFTEIFRDKVDEVDET